MVEQQQEPAYLTVNEVAERLNVSRWKVTQWIKDGILTTVDSHYDKSVKLIRLEDVQRLAREPRVPSRRGRYPRG